MTPQERLGAVLCDEIFDAYWDATARLSTTDLVIFYDQDRGEIRALARQALLDDLPPELDSLRQHARDTNARASATTTFWLIVSFSTGELTVGAVHARGLSPVPGGVN